MTNENAQLAKYQKACAHILLLSLEELLGANIFLPCDWSDDDILQMRQLYTQHALIKRFFAGHEEAEEEAFHFWLNCPGRLALKFEVLRKSAERHFRALEQLLERPGLTNTERASISTLLEEHSRELLQFALSNNG